MPTFLIERAIIGSVLQKTIRPNTLGLQQTSRAIPLFLSRNRTYGINTRLIYSDPDAAQSILLKEKVDRLNTESNLIKSEIRITKTEMRSDIALLRSELTSLNNNLTTQLKCLTDTISAQNTVLSTNIELRMHTFENRFVFRMLFVGIGVIMVGVGATINSVMGEARRHGRHGRHDRHNRHDDG